PRAGDEPRSQLLPGLARAPRLVGPGAGSLSPARRPPGSRPGPGHGRALAERPPGRAARGHPRPGATAAGAHRGRGRRPARRLRDRPRPTAPGVQGHLRRVPAPLSGARSRLPPSGPTGVAGDVLLLAPRAPLLEPGAVGRIPGTCGTVRQGPADSLVARTADPGHELRERLLG